MDLESVYFEYEEEFYHKIVAMINETKGLPVEVFNFLLDKIYKRRK